MRSAIDAQGADRISMEKGWQQGLQDQHGAAATANGEGVVTGADLGGCEDQFGGADFSAIHGGIADRGSGLDACKVLAHEAGLWPLATNVGDAEGLASDEGQGQRRAQELAATGFA